MMTNEGAGHLTLITDTLPASFRERYSSFTECTHQTLEGALPAFCSERPKRFYDFRRLILKLNSVFEVPRSRRNVCVWSKILGLSGGTGNGLMRDGGRARIIGG